MSEIDMSPASRLCTACGMCCDGTWFRAAYAREDDLAIAKQLGIEVFRKEDGSSRLKLPCPRFKGCCTVYDKTRPNVCGDFSCKLLNSVSKDPSQIEAALAMVNKARLLQTEVSKLLTDAKTVPLSYEEVMDRVAPLHANAILRKENARLLMLAAGLDVHLNEYFFDKN